MVGKTPPTTKRFACCSSPRFSRWPRASSRTCAATRGSTRPGAAPGGASAAAPSRLIAATFFSLLARPFSNLRVVGHEYHGALLLYAYDGHLAAAPAGAAPRTFLAALDVERGAGRDLFL